MNREEYEKKLVAEKGQDYLDKNKGLLDSQWEYIESLGDPSDNKPVYRKDLIISLPDTDG